MDFNEIISFEGGINTDDTPQGVPKGDYRDFSYCRLGYNSGNAYAVETSDGTLVIPNAQIDDADQILGATPWLKNNSIVYFVFKADLDHQIWVYDITNQTHTLAVQGSELNFSRDWPIFHSNIIDDILKWTDGRWDPQMYEADGTRLFNPPYQINLAKALESPTPNGYYPVIDLQTIDAIKWPLDPPRVSYFTDPNRQDNKLRNKLFKFIIQPIYENGEVGVWSMYSNLDLPQQSELIPGTNWVFLNNSNGIRIQFNTGPKIIRKFNLAVQQFDKDSFGAEPPFGIFLQLDKEQDSLPDNEIWSVEFYGGASTVAAVNVFKNYDRLPVIADCQEYLPTNQLTYVNFREGYNKPSEPYEILNVNVEYNLNEIDWNAWAAIDFQVVYNFASSTITTDNNSFEAAGVNAIFPYSAGFIFFAPAPTSASISQVVYQLTQQDIDTALASGPNIVDWNKAIMEIVCDSFMDQLGYAQGSAVVVGLAVQYQFTSGPNVGGSNPKVKTVKQTLATPSLKAGATHEFGIVYGDRAFRDSTVYTVDSMNLFVPWFYDIDRSGLSNPDNPFTINADFTINHIPPVWADRYWIVAKPATEILSFGQYTTNANSLVPGQQGYVSSIKLDEVTRNRYVIAIDKYYVTQNLGASIRHQIKIGDKIRFIRRRLDAPGTDASQIAYLPYLELDVVDYNPAGEGFDGRQVVYTNIFDTSLIETAAGLSSVSEQLFGQLIEIYTPRPSIDDTGNIFVSTWKDVSEAIEIRNAHTEDRAHGAPPKYYLTVGIPPGGSTTIIYMNGDFSFLEGSGQSITIHYDDGTSTVFPVGVIVTFAKYNPSSNITGFVLPGVVPDSSMSYITFDNIYQSVSNLSSLAAARFELDYGDVYVRQRNYQTGMAGGSSQAYYFVEDPNYSDYWLSNIHNTGRTRVEDQNAKMIHRQATAIHSDSFIFGTQINGLSSFSLDNQNIEDMNPIFGPVVRAYMSGREGKTLKCLQPKKENSIYIQYYPNEVGSDSTVRVSNRTFASWFDYKSLLGCSNSGATAILPNGSTMYFDNNTGVFVYSGGNGQIQVSEIDPDTGKDYKFRTKTKELAKSYNASPNPMVRTYVNESVGEVGFAFRFDVPYTGIAYGAFDGEVLPYFRIDGDVQYLYGYDIVLVFEESGNTYSGNINYVFYDEESNYTFIGIEGVTPSIDDYNQPGYYYTTSGLSYDHVVFDYVNMRWRSTYDYNFQQFCNLGQTLVGWGVDNQLYLHNQPNEWNFHGDSFTQKVSFVSNEQPLMLKRYQDISLISDDLFSITAQSESNKSYPLGMKTIMPTNLISTYEGYGKVNYRKNLYDPKFFNNNNTCSSYYNPPSQLINGWVFDFDQSTLVGQVVTILQAGGDIFTGEVLTAVYDAINDWTLVTLQGQQPDSNNVPGTWYYSDIAMWNGEDIRANALTHTLEYDPTINNTGSVLVSVGIKGVLS
jgi:hypothetical protein